MRHTINILGVRQQDIYRHPVCQHHIGDDRFKGRIALKYNTDAMLSLHFIIMVIVIHQNQLSGCLALRVGKDLFYGTGFCKFTMIDNCYVRSDLLHNCHLMRNNYNGNTIFLIDLL